MKKLNFLLFLSVAGLCAVDEMEFAPSFQSGMPLPKEHSIPIISQSTREEDSWKFSFGANFNEYQATADSMELAYPSNLSNGLFPSFTIPEGPIIVLDFDYHPGFQVGFILETPYDTWNFGGDYLWFRGHSRGSADLKSNTYYFSPVFVGPFGNFLNSLDADWHLDIDMIDLYLSRPYFSGEKLNMTPFLGLKGGWIRQNFDLTSIVFATTSNVQTASTQTRVWMIGPELGFQGNFFIGSGFSLFGNLATSLLFARYNTLELEYLNALDESSFLHNNGVSTFRGIMDSGLGINWESKGKYKINLNAAYNLAVYFSQIMDRTLVAISTAQHKAPGNLYLSGLSVGTSFVF